MSRRVWAGLVAAILLVAGAGVWLAARQADGQVRIPAHGADRSPTPAPTPLGTESAPASGPRYVTSVAGHHFADQYGAPIWVRGDSPWSMMTDLLPADAETYLSTRAAQGFNAVLVSLVGATANGAPHDDGSTIDGIAPFTGADITDWNPVYWQRVRSYVDLAAAHGITVFAYPMDGWTMGHAVVPASVDECATYGEQVADLFAGAPNLVWLVGGDYFPQTNDLAAGSDVDHCFAAMLDGLRRAGDARPRSIQLGYDESVSSDNPYWAKRIDWDFAYTYHPTYQAVRDAYASGLPVLLGEGNYEGENNQPETPDTTMETLRRQVLWAATSGVAGDFFGTNDWEFLPGWPGRLDSPGVGAVTAARDIVAGLDWPDVAPAPFGELVTGGEGTCLTKDEAIDVLDNDCASAAATADGDLTVVYVPTARTLTLDAARLPAGAGAQWVDPVSGADLDAGTGPTYSTPGTNAGGDGDWLLVVRSP